MPADPTAALSTMLRDSSIIDHEEMLKAANAAIKANKSDLISLQTRVVALLNLDRFEDALRAIEDGGLDLHASCPLEKAYALYKIGSLEDATSVLKSVGIAKRGFKHVAAQVAYRAERFDEAAEIYNRLLDSDPAGEENDLKINLKAVMAHLEWQGYPPPVSTEDYQLDTFDLCYNTACAYIGKGLLDQAVELLQRALKLCDTSDLTDEDKESEMRPILAQQAYVYSRLGKMLEAKAIYETIGATKSDDIDFSIIVENNKAAGNESPRNPYMLKREAEVWFSKAPQAKLFNFQSRLLTRNQFAVDLKALKIPGVESRTENIVSSTAHPTVEPEINAISVMNAAAATYGKTGNVLTNCLVELSKKRPNDVGVALTLVQTHVQNNKAGAALATLQSFLDRLDKLDEPSTESVRFSPGLVALAVSLLRADGQESAAKNELLKAIKYWNDRPATPAISLLREAGIEILRSSNPSDLRLAGSAFEKLFDEHRGSHIAAAGMVASLATINSDKVQRHVVVLPEIQDLVADVDVESLIRGGVVTLPRSAAVKRRAAADDGVDKASRKRRKRKLPNNYEEGKTPDPERWLPLRDRSTYRPKGKKGKKKAAESTQGGMVKDEETLGLVGGGGVKVERAPQANKKKKKGKK